MRSLLIIVMLLTGCAASEPLAVARAADGLKIERSSRFTIHADEVVRLVSDVDPRDERRQALVLAAYHGLLRVFPRTTLGNQKPRGQARPDWRVGSEAWLHISVPEPVDGGERRFVPDPAAPLSFGVALVDPVNHAAIDTARLTISPALWTNRVNDATVSALFEKYASQLLAKQ